MDGRGYRMARQPATSFSEPKKAGSPSVFTDVRATGRQAVVPASAVEEPEIIEPGEVVRQTPASDSLMAEDDYSFSAGSSCGGGECDDCDTSGLCDPCEPPRDEFGYECFDGRLNCWWVRDLTVSAGVHGFKGPRDLNQNGNFGLHEGVEFSGPLGDPWNIGYQLGANFEQSNFSGSREDSVIHKADRKQYFLTAALFRRAECSGFQYGVAYDYLHDSYLENVYLQQIRSESSYLFCNKFELGYFGVYGVSSSRIQEGLRQHTAKLEPTDMFCVYARRYFENGGDGRIWGGATAYGDGLLGADLWVPLGKGFALENAAAYVIPKQGTGETAQQRESWGLTMSLVWYPGRSALNQQHNPYRPIFRTADNTMFMIDRVSP
jgi:hypothetical protein